MDNNENKPRDGANSGERADGRKPFHKHHHHRRPNKERRNDGAPRSPESSRGDSISTQPGRFDLPPQNTVENPSGDAAPKDTTNGTAAHQNHRPRRHRGDRRRHHGSQTATVGAGIGDPEVLADKTLQESESAGGTSSSDSDDHSPKHLRRRHDRRRTDEHSSVRTDIKDTQSEDTGGSMLSDSAEPVSEKITVSEYITTAGSVDSEIVDELNSVSAGEAELMESAEESPEDIPHPTPEAELARYEIVGIRFKTGGKIYYFDPREMKFRKNDPVIVETSRGLEFGICEISNRTVTEREVVLPLRTVVRAATPEDVRQHETNVAQEKEAFAICSQKILDHKLGMKLIDVEYAFDASKLLFYFTAEGRVDFRELVKDLAAVFRTRIELRQIGIRDETKLLGGIGICGRPFCCKTFLSDFVQVSIKMAKEQNLSLNSVKISGACGRLMCCLRYEYDTYQEEIKKTPKVDQIVETPDGEGTVIEVQPLAGLVRVRFGAKTDMIPPKVYHRDDVKVIGGKGVKPKDGSADR